MPAPISSWMPISEFARRVGVNPARLRKWESRYGLLRPTRTPGNRRLYSRADQLRAQQMLRHVKSGIRAAQAAELAIIATPDQSPGATRAAIEHAAVTATSTASFKSSLVPMLVANDQRQYVDVNQAACLLLRLSRDDVLRLSVDDLTPAGLGDATAALWEAFIRDRTQTGTVELRMPDGARFRVDYSAKADVEPGRHLSLLYFPASSDREWGAATAPVGVQLTKREREVLTLIAMGERGGSIALSLGISSATVETHVRHCLTKLGAKSRAHAIALGLERGEITIRLG